MRFSNVKTSALCPVPPSASWRTIKAHTMCYNSIPRFVGDRAGRRARLVTNDRRQSLNGLTGQPFWIRETEIKPIKQRWTLRALPRASLYTRHGPMDNHRWRRKQQDAFTLLSFKDSEWAGEEGWMRRWAGVRGSLQVLLQPITRKHEDSVQCSVLNAPVIP